MSNNLDTDQMVPNQADKETTSNDADGQLDAAITETLSKAIDNTNTLTLTDLELQRALFITLTDGGTTAACTMNVPAIKRGSFVVLNNCGEELTIQVSGQTSTPPVVSDGATAHLISDGADVRVLTSSADPVSFEDGTTNTTPVIHTLTRLTTGTAGDGIGGVILMQSEDDGGNTENVAAIKFRLDDVSVGTEVGALGLGTYDAGVFTEILTLVGGNVIVPNGTISVDDVTDSSSTTTGSMQTDGGLGVVKTIVAGTGIKLGGTASANLLDDYEEGTFSPGLSAASGTITLSAANDTLAYTKIGRLVTITGQLIVASVSSPTGALTMTGLPFTAADLTDSSGRAGGAQWIATLASAISGVPVWSIGEATTTVGIEDFDGTTVTNDLAVHIGVSTQFKFSFQYFAA